jgi:hypothetical protein
MIHGVIGKPRGGKSYWMTKHLINELVNGTRTVVTNLPLVPDQIAKYIAEHHPGAEVDLLNRLRMISSDSNVAGEFWRFRGPVFDSAGLFGGWLELPGCNKETGAVDVSAIVPRREADGTVTAEEKKRCAWHRCAYYIDEIYNYYNCREWQKLGRRALWYCAQHAKFGDSVFLATHMVADIDKQMLGRFQDYIYLRNHSKEKVGGVFKSWPWMSWKMYATQYKPGAVLMDSGKFTVDVTGIGKCYETDAGVGIGGGMGSDVGEKAKGLPLWTAFAGFLIAVPILSFLVPGCIQKGIAKSVGAMATVPVMAPAKVAEIPRQPPSASVSPAAQAAASRAEPAMPLPVVPGVPVKAKPLEWEKDLQVSGLQRKDGVATLYFTDGSQDEFEGATVRETGAGVFYSSGDIRTKWRWAKPVGTGFNAVGSAWLRPADMLERQSMPVPSGAAPVVLEDRSTHAGVE